MKANPRISSLMTVAAFAAMPGVLFMPSTSFGFGAGAVGAATSSSPREAVVAAPVMALSGSPTSQASVVSAAKASEAAPAASAPAPSSKPSGGGTSSGGSKGSSSGAATSSSKDVVLSKNPVIEPAPAGPEIAFTAGWDSRYMFKSRDNVDATSNDPVDSSIWYAKLSLAYEGFGFNLGYLQAAEETHPRNATSASQSDYYSEVILGANYTASIIGGVLDATVGYNAYLFPEDAFWGGNYQGEIFARVSYVQIDHIRPSITYSYFHADTFVDLEGSWLEFRVDGDFNLYDSGSVSVNLNPYVSLGYDGIEYNGESDWSAIEVGVRIPITINENLIIALSANYGWGLNDDHSWFSLSGAHNDEVGFWGGASITYRF